MKIAIVNHDFSLGGVQRVAIEIAGSLSQVEGYSVSLVSFSGNDNFFFDVSEKCKKEVNTKKRTFSENLKFRMAIKRCRRIEISRVYRNQLRGLILILREGGFDCVILCQSDLTALIPRIKAEVPSIKAIGWQHNDFETYFTNYDYAKLFLGEYTAGLEWADYIVCLTENDQQQFKKYNSNTSFIYNPLTLKTDKISNLKNNSVIFTGKTSLNQKGMDYFIQLATRSPSHWNFQAAGDGADIDAIKKTVKDKNLDSKIQFIGAVKDAELLKHYLSGDVFVSTSRWEGFGLAIIEAMKCGLPIVAFDNNGPREILDGGKYGILIERFNVDQMYKELAKLMNDDKLRKIYQEKSLKRVERFSLDQIVEEWKEIIDGMQRFE